jgi:hypothetical protein
VKEEVVTVKLTFGNCNLNSSSMKYLALLILMCSENLYSQNADSVLYAEPKKYFKLVDVSWSESRINTYVNTKKFKTNNDTLSFELIEYDFGRFSGISESKCLISNGYEVLKNGLALPSANPEYYQKIISIYKQTLKKKK